MPATSNAKLTESPPSTLTPLQNKAIQWIAGMQWAIAKREGTKDYQTIKIPAHQLEAGMSIITRHGHLWLIESLRSTKSTVAAIAKRDGKTHVFHIAPNELVSVEAE